MLCSLPAVRSGTTEPASPPRSQDPAPAGEAPWEDEEEEGGGASETEPLSPDVQLETPKSPLRDEDGYSPAVDFASRPDTAGWFASSSDSSSLRSVPAVEDGAAAEHPKCPE